MVQFNTMSQNETMPFVPKEQEDEYLQRFNFNKIVLPNGITVCQFPLLTEEAKNASVTVRFPAGHFYDPVSKTGMHHLLEHLIMNNETGKLVTLHNGYYNATTATDEMNLMLNGVANPDFKEYGVWPFLDSIYNSVADPFGHHKSIQEALDEERGIVIREMAERTAAIGWKNSFFMQRTVYNDKNPGYHIHGGIKSELETISVGEFQSLAENVFIPQGTYVFVETWGDYKNSDEVTKEVIDRFAQLTDKGKMPNSYDPALKDEMNSGLEGNVFTSEELYGPTRDVEINWIMEYPRFGREYFAVGDTVVSIKNRLNTFVREKGLSYGAGASIVRGNNKFRLVLTVKLEDRANFAKYLTSEFYPLILGEMNAMTKGDFYNPFDELRRKATPILKGDRKNDIMKSLIDANRISDSDELRARAYSVSPSEIEAAKNMIVATKPFFLVV